MNKISILITGFAMLVILTGCVSAREQQNPQPKAELICQEWGKGLNVPVQKKELTLREAAEKFIFDCSIGNYSEMFANVRYHDDKIKCSTLANATVQKIELQNDYGYRKYWNVTVLCPSDSNTKTFVLKYDEKKKPTWSVDVDTIKSIPKTTSQKSQPVKAEKKSPANNNLRQFKMRMR